MKIAVIVGSTRIGRQTPKVAKLVHRIFLKYPQVEIETVDLKELNLPFLVERLKYHPDPPDSVIQFSEKVASADLLLVVSPEYNGGIPGVLKNALDYLNDEYTDKPVGLVTVSAGPHGGKKCYEALLTQFKRVGARPIEEHLQVNNVNDSLDDDGNVMSGNYEALSEMFANKILKNI